MKLPLNHLVAQRAGGIGGSVSWMHKDVPPVVEWRSGQVNLGFQHKDAVGTNWTVHETLRDLKSSAFCDTLDMRQALYRLDEAVACFARDHWDETEEIPDGNWMGKVVQGNLPGMYQYMHQVLKKREEVLFADGHAKTDEELLARGDGGAARFERRIEENEADWEAWFNSNRSAHFACPLCLFVQLCA